MPTRTWSPDPCRLNPARAAQFILHRLLIAGVALLACGLWTPVARAADEANVSCLGCHGDPGIERISAGSGGSVHVNAREFAGSVHGKMACRLCHVRATAEFPHPANMPRVRCATCHGAAAAQAGRSAHAQNGAVDCAGCHGTHDVRPAAHSTERCASCHKDVSHQYAASLHGEALKRGDTDAPKCTDCHGGWHEILPHRDPASPVSHQNLAKTCARCHADRALTTRRKITIPEATALFEKSVHGRSDDPRAATCNSCHESHELKRATDPASSIYRTNIPTTCGRCHSAETQAYRTGVHGQALRRGVTATPVCTDCHGEHLIRGPHDPDSPVLAAQVTTTCSRCHEAQGIRETYSLAGGRRATYEDSFHGLASKGGSPAVANCASCHGFHDILPSSDPASSVSPQRLAETCGKCHPGAGTEVAMGPVHEAMATPSNPVLWWVRWVYLGLIFGTIGGMVAHNALDFARKMQNHYRLASGAFAGPVEAEAHAHATAGTPVRWFERMNLAERIQHFLLLTSFFALVYTGFALKFPDSWPFAWLARLESGYAWRSVSHRVAAVVMTLAALIHIGYLFTRRGRQLVRDLFPRIQDAFQAVQNLLYLVGLRREPPKFERFGYYEKAEYWALIWGTAVMTLTGVMLWFENQSLRLLPKWILDLATLVHYYEAWLAFLAIVVWHLYMVIANPDVYPMNWTWLTGRISEQQMQHEHRAEWERMMAAEAAAAPPEPDAPAATAKDLPPAEPAAPPAPGALPPGALPAPGSPQ